jgi:hypothetical protein
MADLTDSDVKSLGNLKEVGHDLILTGSKIESLGDLENVGGHIILLRTPLQGMINPRDLEGTVKVGMGIVG